MNAEQSERLIAAEEKKAEALIMIATLLQRWYDTLNPIIEPAEPAEVYNVHDPHPEPETRAQYEALPEEGKGRFEKLIESYQIARS